MSVSWKLEVTEGPRRGDKIALKTDGPTLIGRSKQGLDLLDPRVSTRHAELRWKDDRFWVVDLGSATGTMVDGIGIGGEPVPLSAGNRLLIGDTLIVLLEERRVLPQWIYWVALVVLAICTPYFIQMIFDWSIWDKMTPVIAVNEAVLGHRGTVLEVGGDIGFIPLDRCHMRETFTDGRDSRVHRVTDMDKDGVSEIWIEGDSWERIYTFGDGDHWQLIGELPKGCQYAPGSGFRDLVCSGQTYKFKTGIPFQPGKDRCAVGSNKGRYELTKMNGAVVWMVSGAGPSAIGEPVPYQLGIRQDTRLATWLGERNVTRPVHFIVCEEMFPNIGAQVLTVDGRIERLNPGCSEAIEIAGGRREDYQGSRPAAIAFSDTGRKHLIDQLGVFLGGSKMGHFQNQQQLAWWKKVSEPPLEHTASFVQFNPGPNAATQFHDPIPSEDATLELTDIDRLGGLEVPGLRRAEVWQWTGQSNGVLRTPCGRLINIKPEGWRCGPPCVRGSTPFLTITDTQTQKYWSYPYEEVWNSTERADGIEIEVDLHTGPPGYVRQAIAASVAVRDTKSCSASDNGNLPIRPKE